MRRKEASYRACSVVLTFSSTGVLYSSTNLRRNMWFIRSTSHACVQNESCTPAEHPQKTIYDLCIGHPHLLSKNVLVYWTSKNLLKYGSDIKFSDIKETCKTQPSTPTSNGSHHHVWTIQWVHKVRRERCSLLSYLNLQQFDIVSVFENTKCLDTHRNLTYWITLTLQSQNLKRCFYLHLYEEWEPIIHHVVLCQTIITKFLNSETPNRAITIKLLQF